MHTCSLNHYSNMKNATIITTPIYLSKNNNVNAKQVKDTKAILQKKKIPKQTTVAEH